MDALCLSKRDLGVVCINLHAVAARNVVTPRSTPEATIPNESLGG